MAETKEVANKTERNQRKVVTGVVMSDKTDKTRVVGISRRPRARPQARKGKGAPEKWVAVVKPGRVLFELEGVPEDVARSAFTRVSHKLPIKVKFVKRHGA